MLSPIVDAIPSTNDELFKCSYIPTLNKFIMQPLQQHCKTAPKISAKTFAIHLCGDIAAKIRKIAIDTFFSLLFLVFLVFGIASFPTSNDESKLKL